MNSISSDFAAYPVTLIGHPNLSIGRGEHIRAVWRALRAAGITARVYNLHQRPAPDEPAFQELVAHTVAKIPNGVRIFHLNGNEIAGALAVLERRQPGVLRAGHNIVFPAWELARYPGEWAIQLERFDEIWAPSTFVERCLRAAVSVPVILLANACEPHLAEPLPRKHFSLDESRFVILFFFDLSSYTSRKNPAAVIETFRRVVAARPAADVQLVLKLNNTAGHPRIPRSLRDLITPLGDRVRLLDTTLTDKEVKSLVACCDCFLSLHRSEGFGRGPAEAMFFGKPVVATGWSGNMEYMNEEVSFPVGFDLVPVKEGEYPAWRDQHWAEPKISDAVGALLRIIDTPALARAIGERARLHMRRNFSDHVLGLRYRERVREIMERAVVSGKGAQAPVRLSTLRLLINRSRFFRKGFRDNLPPSGQGS
jgi:glycosyltransferase involved in cell wall biosynthesis